MLLFGAAICTAQPTSDHIAQDQVLAKLTAIEMRLARYESQLPKLRTEWLDMQDRLGSQYLANYQHFDARFRTLEHLLGMRQPVMTLPDAEPEQPPAADFDHGWWDVPLTATFLRHGAQYSTHFFLAHSLTDAQREAELDWHQGHGYNSIHWYLWLWGDYGGHHRYEFTRLEAQRVLHWVARAREHGLEPVLWLMSDDEFRWFNRNDLAEVRTRWQTAIDTVIAPGKIRYVVMGLEALEYWSESQATQLGKWLRSALPDETALIWHTLNGDKRLIGSDWMDAVAWQSGFGFSAPEVAGQISALRSEFPSLPVIAGEYHKSGETDEARTIGSAALRAGAVGAWNGSWPEEVQP